MKQWEFPSLRERAMILGSTGSGKTNMFLWLISHAPFEQQPYVIFDYKRDEHIARIDRARQIGLNELPRYPGLYVIRPFPDVDDDNVLGWLRGAWSRRNIGLGFDEAMMLPQRGGALKAIFIQGRALKLPVIACSQRPVDLERTMLSEASHVSVFSLNDRRDHKSVREQIPLDSERVERLPQFHSLWFRRRDKQTFEITPIKNYEMIPARINSRLPQPVYFI